jgi:hypothetical protein
MTGSTKCPKCSGTGGDRDYRVRITSDGAEVYRDSEFPH